MATTNRSAGEALERFSEAVTRRAGSTPAFGAAAGVVVVWAALGPVFGFSDTWQLVMNTISSVVTFLMVFLIQNTQNRDAVALHLKLDELLRAVEGAREKKFVDLEEKSDEVVQEVKKELVQQAGSIATEQERVQQDRTQQEREKVEDRDGQPAAG